METYIGTKILRAMPLDLAAYNEYRGWEVPADEDGAVAGYLVEYLDGGEANHPEHKGYISWSPRAVFEGAYLEVGNLSAHSPHQQRVICEAAELENRLTKLTEFSGKAAFKSLPREERQRLVNQSGAMREYLDILKARIAAF